MTIPRKRFGQHFLCDQGVIQHIVSSLAPSTTDHLVEIGPGQGALTVPVLKQAKRLQAIELDRDLIEELARRTERIGTLTVYSADVLDFDFRSLIDNHQRLRVFGNLPYNISTPLIFHVLSFADIIIDMLFMLQKEVAERMAAKAGTDFYGRLSVMVQYRCQVEILFDVSAQSFYPPPQVQSSIIRLVPHAVLPFPAHDEVLFADIVKQAFGQRRKTLRNSLKHLVNDEVWSQSTIRSDLRAENLRMQDFVELANLCHGAR
jgi:16S rRNA (adenine1518-N6/adenine1519-N6)-dimethyltransferase